MVHVYQFEVIYLNKQKINSRVFVKIHLLVRMSILLDSRHLLTLGNQDKVGNLYNRARLF